MQLAAPVITASQPLIERLSCVNFTATYETVLFSHPDSRPREVGRVDAAVGVQIGENAVIVWFLDGWHAVLLDHLRQ